MKRNAPSHLISYRNTNASYALYKWTFKARRLPRASTLTLSVQQSLEENSRVQYTADFHSDDPWLSRKFVCPSSGRGCADVEGRWPTRTLVHCFSEGFPRRERGERTSPNNRLYYAPLFALNAHTMANWARVCAPAAAQIARKLAAERRPKLGCCSGGKWAALDDFAEYNILVLYCTAQCFRGYRVHCFVL